MNVNSVMKSYRVYVFQGRWYYESERRKGIGTRPKTIRIG